jgi:hypothetical protein
MRLQTTELLLGVKQVGTWVNKSCRRGGAAGYLPSDGPRSLLAPTHQGSRHETAGE